LFYTFFCKFGTDFDATVAWHVPIGMAFFFFFFRGELSPFSLRAAMLIFQTRKALGRPLSSFFSSVFFDDYFALA